MQRKISRRTVLVGLTGAAAAAGVGYLIFKPTTGDLSENVDPRHQLRYTGHRYARNAVWSPDSTRVASTGESDPTVQVWNAITGKKLLTCSLEDAGAGLLPISVAWSADGKEVLAAATETERGYNFIRLVQVWDAATGKPVRTLPIVPEDTAELAALDLNERYLATAASTLGTPDKKIATIEVWDNTTGSKVATLDTAFALAATPGNPTRPPDGSAPTPSSSYDFTLVRALLWAPDSGKLAVGLDKFDRPRAVWQIWDVSTGKMIPTIQQGGNEVHWALAWSPDGQSLVVGEVIYDVEAGRQITTYSTGGELRALTWSPNGKRLAVNTATRKVLYKPPYGALRIFDASIGREIANYQEGSVTPAYNPLNLNPRTMAWAPDGKNLLLVQDSIDIWKMD